MVLNKLRGLFRLLVVVISLIEGILTVLLLTLKHGGRLTTLQRARAVQQVCATMLRRLSVRLEMHGYPPSDGLLVSNHLSYLDVLAFGAATPCVFVSKIEVLRWPIFGQAGAIAGTVFVDRSKTAVGSQAIARVEEILRQGVCVLLFPEGKSTDGTEVLKFYSSFFEPAVQSGAVVTAAAIAYPDGADYIEKDLCYYDDIAFFPRLFETLCLRSVVARLDFAATGRVFHDRKIAAVDSRGEVVALRAAQLASFARDDGQVLTSEQSMPLV